MSVGVSEFMSKCSYDHVHVYVSVHIYSYIHFHVLLSMFIFMGTYERLGFPDSVVSLQYNIFKDLRFSKCIPVGTLYFQQN
jgi:hypothetical protein